MGRLLWMCYNRAKCLLVLSFIYLFVSLFAHAIVRAFRVHMFKKKKRKEKKRKKVTCRSIGRQNGRACFYYYYYYYYYYYHHYYYHDYYYYKDPDQTVRMHMHMLIWNFGGHMFSWTSSLISCKSFFLLWRPKDLDQTVYCRCTCMHMPI